MLDLEPPFSIYSENLCKALQYGGSLAALEVEHGGEMDVLANCSEKRDFIDKENVARKDDLLVC